MTSQQKDDIARIRETIGGDFELVPAADETLSDATLGDLSAIAKAPSLSALRKQRLGVQDTSNPGEGPESDSGDDLFQRFTTEAHQAASAATEAREEPARNRVYFKKPRTQSDTEAFAPKPIVVSGTTGKITESG